MKECHYTSKTCSDLPDPVSDEGVEGAQLSFGEGISYLAVAPSERNHDALACSPSLPIHLFFCGRMDGREEKMNASWESEGEQVFRDPL